MEDLLQFLLSAEGSKYIIYGIVALALLSTSLVVLSGWYRYTKANAPWGRLARRTGLTLIPGHLLFPQRPSRCHVVEVASRPKGAKLEVVTRELLGGLAHPGERLKVTR